MSNHYSEAFDRYARVFSALANPHRLQIYTMLSGCCIPGTGCTVGSGVSCCVGDLGGRLKIAASTLSHHLKELNQAGLIDMERDGKQVICSVNSDMLDNLRHYFQTISEVQHESKEG